MIDKRRKLIFVHVPRTGGSSIEISFNIGLQTLERNNTIGSFHDKHWRASAYKTANPRQWDLFFKFSLVRNPWDRVISLYEWLKMHKTHPQRTTDSFKDWLLSITPNCNSYKTQSWYLNETMDFVGRYENLHKDWPYLVSNAFPLDAPAAPLPHINKTQRHGVYHDAETIDFVGNYYRDDIDSYGYEPPSLPNF